MFNLILHTIEVHDAVLLLKVMLHGTARNDDFQPNTALQCWNNVATIQNNVGTMLQRYVALKIVVANRLV